MGKVSPEQAKWRSYHTSPWRKSRICARFYLRPDLVLRDRYRKIAAKLLHDPEVTNRLIDQAVASLKGAAYQKSLGRNTPAGQALKTLAKAISDRGLHLSAPILVFGSGPLQIFVDQHLLSKDVDVSAGKQMEEVKAIVDEIGYGEGKAKFYIEVVPLYIFRAGQNWGARGFVEKHRSPMETPFRQRNRCAQGHSRTRSS